MKKHYVVMLRLRRIDIASYRLKTKVPKHIAADYSKLGKFLIREIIMDAVKQMSVYDPNKGYLIRAKDLPGQLAAECYVFERKKNNSPSRSRLLARSLNTPVGRRAFANAMAAPLRRNLDYQGVSRSFIKIEPLTEDGKEKFDVDLPSLPKNQQ